MLKSNFIGFSFTLWLVFLIPLIFISCENESYSPAQAESFLKLFGSYQKDVGYDVKALPDGGFIITGSVMTVSNGNDIVLIRTDKYGNKVWEPKYFGERYNDAGYSVEALPDGGFVILGYITDTTVNRNQYTNMYLVRLSSAGETIWTKKYGGKSEEGKGEIGYDVKTTSDNGFIIVGSTENFGLGGKDVWLIKTDVNGDTLWTRTHGGLNDDIGKSVLETSYGYIFTGYTESFSAPGQAAANIFVVKTNTIGKEVFPYTYGSTGNDYGESLTALQGGGYVITGSSFNPQTGTANALVMKVEEQIAQITWTKLFGGQVNHYGISVKVTSDNGFIIAGTQELSTSNHNIFLLKTDPGGAEEYLYTFGGTGLQRAEAMDIANDEGYIITGSNEHEGNSMITLIKTKADGNM